jgi:hypothetical protein
LSFSHGQALGPGEQALFMQKSFSVQEFPSSHDAVLSVKIQPNSTSHVSSVQALSSVHTAAGPEHEPAEQVSSSVQMFPSSQVVPSGAATDVQVPPTQEAIWQFSCGQSLSWAQLQADVSCWQVLAEHESTVHAMPSSQFSGVPSQEPPEHASFVVHASLSLQLLALLVYSHPVSESHESVVQMLLSLQEIVV